MALSTNNLPPNVNALDCLHLPAMPCCIPALRKSPDTCLFQDRYDSDTVTLIKHKILSLANNAGSSWDAKLIMPLQMCLIHDVMSFRPEGQYTDANVFSLSKGFVYRCVEF